MLKDMERATEAKSSVEDAQREQRRKMEESGQKHVSRFFELSKGRWLPKLQSVLFHINSFLYSSLTPLVTCQ
jgi:hypothetical protein